MAEVKRGDIVSVCDNQGCHFRGKIIEVDQDESGAMIRNLDYRVPDNWYHKECYS